MPDPTGIDLKAIGAVAKRTADLVKDNGISFDRGDAHRFFTKLGYLHAQFTLPLVPREHVDTVIHLKNLYGLWNSVVDDEIDQRGGREQLDASLQLLLNLTRGEPSSARDCDAVRILAELFRVLQETRPYKERTLEALHFDLWDLMNGFSYEYCITKYARVANSVEYAKYSTMTASIKHYLDFDCLYLAENLSASDYRHLRVGYEHLALAIKFASDIGSLGRELKNEDNFNLVRVLALESGVAGIERRVQSDAEYEALMNQEDLKGVIQKVREASQEKLEAARAALALAPSVDTRMVLKGATDFINIYFRQDQFAPEAPTAPTVLRSVE
jgi:hypothetical protein